MTPEEKYKHMQELISQGISKSKAASQVKLSYYAMKRLDGDSAKKRKRAPKLPRFIDLPQHDEGKVAIIICSPSQVAEALRGLK